MFKTPHVEYSHVRSASEDERIRDAKYERRQKLNDRSFTGMLSALIFASSLATILRWATTRGKQDGAWPKGVVLWPTYVLCGISGVILIADSIALISYCCGIKAANRASTVANVFHYVASGLHVIGWLTGLTIFKWANKTSEQRDLWGWSCGDAAKKFVNINASDILCPSNTGSFYITIIQILLEIFGIIILAMTLHRMKTKKKLERDAAVLDNEHFDMHNIVDRVNYTHGYKE